MSVIAKVATVEMPHKLEQRQAKEFARTFFSKTFTDVERILPAFDNAQIDTRNFAMPYEFYTREHTFEEKNRVYIEQALAFGEEAIVNCLRDSGFGNDDVTDFIFVSTTGLATPSLDAQLINRMKLNPHINRMPLWGLGCAGGVSGIGKANAAAQANPHAVVLMLSVELCSLTFIEKDYSKSNFIATGLFSDGAACALVLGDEAAKKFSGDSSLAPRIVASKSKLYYDTLDVMGWDFLDSGFKVIFSRDIPTIINNVIATDIESFLSEHGLTAHDVRNWVAHPGGAKVIAAYVDALKVDKDCFRHTSNVLRRYGNMSSATVLYVLKEFFNHGFDSGYGLMMALGPGFSSEQVLVRNVS